MSKNYYNVYFVITLVLILGISTVFAYSYFAQDIGYLPTDTEWNVDNTKDALDDLYSINSTYATIRFFANGGNVNPSMMKVVKGERLWSLPTPTRDGYVFGGWYTDSSYSTEITTSTLDTSDDVTLTAKWIEGTQISNIPSSSYKSYIGQTVKYNGDTNWSILYIGSNFSLDGVHMYLISKTSRWSGKPTANGSFGSSVLYNAYGFNLLTWGKLYNSSNSNSNGASKTWSMLTPSNYSSYCVSSVCDYAAGGPTIDLYFEAYNYKLGTSINYRQYNGTGYTYNAFSGLSNPFNLSNTNFWFASPGSYGNGWVMVLQGSKSWCLADKDGNYGFNPVVALKKTAIIYHNGTNYVITSK